MQVQAQIKSLTKWVRVQHEKDLSFKIFSDCSFV